MAPQAKKGEMLSTEELQRNHQLIGSWPLRAVVAKVRPAVVQINVVTTRGQGLGSGVIIDQRGYIVTNQHVVDGAQRMEVMLYDGTKLPAQLVGTDSADDLAVVKVTPPKTGLTVATL